MNARILKHTVVALVAASFPLAACAQWWNPAWANAGRMRPAVEYDAALEQQAQYVVFEAVTHGDYAKLDRMHDEFLEMHRADAPGRRLIYQLLPGMNQAFANRAMQAQLDKFFAEWRQAAPDSRLRPIAEAAYHVKRAWTARGGGYSSTVTPEGFKTFQSELEQAARTLEEGRAKGSESPLWYESALAVGGALGAPPAALDAILEEGAGKYPSYGPSYRTRLNYLLPQWGGNYRSIDRFIRAVVMRTQATFGTTFYSDLYAQVLQSYRGEDFFRETSASWPVLRHAYEEEVARGTADLNRYATVACIARDRETTGRLLAQLGDKANLGYGIEGFSTEACAELVREGR